MSVLILSVYLNLYKGLCRLCILWLDLFFSMISFMINFVAKMQHLALFSWYILIVAWPLFSSLVFTCTIAAELFITEMKSRFLSHSVLDAFGVVYPQYLQQGDCEVSFWKQLNILKDFYGEPKWIVEGTKKKVIPPILDRYYWLESK